MIRAAAPAEPGLPPAGGIPVRHLLLALFALFALGNVLVPAFLGKAGIVAVSAILACGFMALLAKSERRLGSTERVAWRTLAICMIIAAVLLVLGGEGRLFFANEDWQVRDAVLADMAHRPWPFAYLAGGGEQMLRAPLGMYFLPALIGQGSQAAGDLALLGCNAIMLGLELALASTMFPAGRTRRIALVVFVTFSGLDIIGTLLATATGGTVSFDHLERWAPPLQYSSVVTLIFWVPQHAMAGWFCALLYLMHRRGSITPGGLAASVPVAAIWSPLAIIGAVPLVALAGLRTLRDRGLRWTDVAVALAALALALPSLAYLAADAQQVPSGFQSVRFVSLAAVFLLEVAPFLWLALRLGGARRFGRDSLALVAAMLVLLPFVHVGAGPDLMMRASIPPLAVLIAILIDGLAEMDRRRHRGLVVAGAVILSLGAVTGVSEVARAIRLAPAPAPHCTLPGVWHRQTERIAEISTYLARTEAMPALLRPEAPVLIDPRADPAKCWSRPWKVAR